MTEIVFHFNVPQRIDYACRLMRKATAAGARVVVTGAADSLRELDVALWTFSPLEFLAHCRLPAEPAVLAATPVVLAEDAGAAPHREVLVNLGGNVPAAFERFDRLIEIVTGDEDDRLAARARWKHYADRGYEIKKHDFAQREPA